MKLQQQEEKQGSRLKQVSSLCFRSITKSSNYVDDEISGPIRPGYYFYKWLSYGPPLELNIPNTFIVHGSTVVHLNTDKNGYITSEAPKLDEDNKTFVSEFVESCIGDWSSLNDHKAKKSVKPKIPLGNNIETPPKHNQLLINTVVAVRKSPDWSQDLVRNKICVLTPIPLQASLIGTLEGDDKECVIQRYIKPKGKYASIFRVFWKREPSSYSTIIGFCIMNTDKFESFNDEKGSNTQLLAKKLHELYDVQLDGSLPHAKEQAIGNDEHGDEVSLADDHTIFSKNSTASLVSNRAKSQASKSQVSFAGLRKGSTLVLPLVQTASNSHIPPSDPAHNHHAVAKESNVVSRVHEKLLDDGYIRMVRNEDVYLDPSDRLAALKIATDVHTMIGHTHCICLSDEIIERQRNGKEKRVASVNDSAGVSRTVTHAVANALEVSRVAPYALGNIHQILDKLALWMRQVVLRKNSVNTEVVELVCDFIKDEHGKFWFIQLKGFQLSDESRLAIAVWKKAQQEKDEDGDEDDINDGTKNKNTDSYFSYGVRPRVSTTDLKRNIESHMGEKCLLCGQSYIAGSVIHLPSEGVIQVASSVLSQY